MGELALSTTASLLLVRHLICDFSHSRCNFKKLIVITSTSQFCTLPNMLSMFVRWILNLVLRLAWFDMLQGWKGILQFNLPCHGDHDWWGTREIHFQPSLWKLSKSETWWATFWNMNSHSYIKRLICHMHHLVHEKWYTHLIICSQLELFYVHLLAAMDDDRFVHHCVCLELVFKLCHGLFWWIVAFIKLVFFLSI